MKRCFTNWIRSLGDYRPNLPLPSVHVTQRNLLNLFLLSSLLKYENQIVRERWWWWARGSSSYPARVSSETRRSSISSSSSVWSSWFFHPFLVKQYQYQWIEPSNLDLINPSSAIPIILLSLSLLSFKVYYPCHWVLTASALSLSPLTSLTFFFSYIVIVPLANACFYWISWWVYQRVSYRVYWHSVHLLPSRNHHGSY